MTALLEVRNLGVEFATQTGLARAVDDVSFSIGAGETVALVGESGSGKTVTALAMLRLIDPPGRISERSHVAFDGTSVLTMAPRALRELRGARMALMLADSLGAFNPLLSIGAQMVETIRAHERTTHGAALTRATDMLARAGIPDPARTVHRFPHELSGGQRQRAALAMALVLRPALLIADEPTSALDVTTQAQVLELLGELRAEFGTALLIITHDFGVVGAAAARVLVMYAGQIVEETVASELLTTPSHPYTRALLGAWPRLGDARRALRPIPGIVPSTTAWPPGCRFRARCQSAWERCEREPPPLVPIDAQRASRCHLVTYLPGA